MRAARRAVTAGRWDNSDCNRCGSDVVGWPSSSSFGVVGYKEVSSISRFQISHRRDDDVDDDAVVVVAAGI